MISWTRHELAKIVINSVTKNYNFALILYGYEIWFLLLKEELRLRVFEKRVLWRIFGPKRDKVVGGWTELHNEELHNLYYWSSIIRTSKSKMMIWVGHLCTHGERRNSYRLLIGKPEGKRPLGIPRRWRVGNIKVDLRDIG
jgi:hypothetical protein